MSNAAVTPEDLRPKRPQRAQSIASAALGQLSTLGTLNIAFALTHIYSRDQTVTKVPAAMTFFGNTFSIGKTDITYGSVLMLILFAITWYVLKQTAVGRHIYALGNNPEAARLTGIRTDRLLLVVYAVAGLIYGVAALLLVA